MKTYIFKCLIDHNCTIYMNIIDNIEYIYHNTKHDENDIMAAYILCILCKTEELI